jgi:hypothetical protein
MAVSHFSGKVDSVDGFSVNGTTVVSSGAALTTASPITVGSTAISEAEIGVLDSVTPGTATASKAVVLGASKEISTITTATITNLTTSTLTLGATALGSTAEEIDQICDASASADTRTGAGAISIDKAYTSLVTTGADALTLAAPGAASIPRIKVIHMTTDGGDGTLASTNIVGQSSGTTSITFNDAGDYLVLVAVPGLNKWSVLKEGGVTAA